MLFWWKSDFTLNNEDIILVFFFFTLISNDLVTLVDLRP